MRVLRLLSRVAFICNICFLLASFIQWIPNPPEGGLVSLVIILGYILSMLVNAVVNVWMLTAFASRRLRAGMVPAWLLIVNFIFFVIQVLLIILHK